MWRKQGESRIAARHEVSNGSLDEPLFIRTFKLRDIPRLYRLGRRGLCLDQESYLVEGYSVLGQALRTWPGTNARTYIARVPGHRLWYVLQVVRRDDRPEWQVTFLAPITRAVRRSLARWRPLLEHALHDVVHKGAYRVYASLPADHPLVELFQATGFRLYTKETIYHGRTSHLPPATPPGLLRPYRPQDEWEFRRLWQRVTPQVVMAAEGLNDGNSLSLPYAWTTRVDQRVFVWEVKGGFLGAVAVRYGDRGRWVRFLLAPDAREGVDAFVLAGLRLAGRRYRGPVYCAVPEYVGGVREVVVEAGFDLLAEHVWLVRYLALPLRADATVPQGILSLLEIRGEPAFTPVGDWRLEVGD